MDAVIAAHMPAPGHTVRGSLTVISHPSASWQARMTII